VIVVVATIASTRTRTGLRVHAAELDAGSYPLGITATRERLRMSAQANEQVAANLEDMRRECAAAR
jgi:hypothetical protein